jgi:hypothetical protein
VDEFPFIERYYSNPVRFCYEVLRVKTLYKEQIKVLEDIVKFNRIAIKSGHGIGKTALLCFIILWFLLTRVDCRIPMTSPSQHQLLDVLIPELTKWCNHSQLNRIIDVTATKISVKGYEKSWFGITRSCRIPENMGGFHADNLLFVIEEASGVEEKIIEVIEGALTKDENKLIMIGNPTRISGAFYHAFHRDRNIYRPHTFNAEESKNVDKSYIKNMARYGKDSAIYRVRVLGEFPKGEPDTLITLDIVEDAINREVEYWDHIEIGVDPARFGDDESVICWRRGNDVQPLETFYGIDTVRLSGEVCKLVREIRTEGYQGRIPVKVDETGIGSGVVDQLNQIDKDERKLAIEEQILKIDVIPLINNGVPYNQDYEDAGSEMWGDMRDAIEESIKLPNDSELVAQLTTRKYDIKKNGQIKLEEKKAMKKRNLPSPDRADALSLCLAKVNPFDFRDAKVETESKEKVV